MWWHIFSQMADSGHFGFFPAPFSRGIFGPNVSTIVQSKTAVAWTVWLRRVTTRFSQNGDDSHFGFFYRHLFALPAYYTSVPTTPLSGTILAWTVWLQQIFIFVHKVHDLEIFFQGHPIWNLKTDMDSQGMSSYLSPIQTMCLSLTVWSQCTSVTHDDDDDGRRRTTHRQISYGIGRTSLHSFAQKLINWAGQLGVIIHTYSCPL